LARWKLLYLIFLLFFASKKGIDLAPLILEIVLWGDKYVRPYNTKMNPYESDNIDTFKTTENI